MIYNKNFKICLLTVALLLIPSFARADAGTPLLWASLIYLFIGNACIGVVEGLLISFVFKARINAAVLFMVLANYFSAWIGVFGLPRLFEYAERWMIRPGVITSPLFNMPLIIGSMFVSSYLASIVLEYPFCLLAFRYNKLEWRALLKKAFLASVLAQTVSYIFLLPFFLGLSSHNNLSIDNSLSFARHSRAQVYYVASDGGLYRVGINGSNRHKVLNTQFRSSSGYYDDTAACLYVRKHTGTNAWDLWINANGKKQMLRSQFARDVARWRGYEQKTEPSRYQDYEALYFSPEKLRNWTISTGSTEEGLRASGDSGQVLISLSTPLFGWDSYNVTVLPENLVVFQMGDDAMSQVFVLDPSSRKIGLLAQGWGPLVIRD